MTVFALNVYQTTGLAMLLFALGTYLVSKIEFLRKVCIPAPVVGGVLFAIVNCVLYMGGIVEMALNDGVSRKTGNKGDLILTVKVETPTKLSEKQKELLRELDASMTGKEYEGRKSFADKIKDLFN